MKDIFSKEGRECTQFPSSPTLYNCAVSKTVYAAVLLHHSPITGNTEIADVVENGYSLFLIFKNKPSLFQYVYLFSEGDGLLCIFHIKRNVPPWSAGLATRSVVGFVGTKVLLLFGIAKLFQRKVQNTST